MFITTVTPKSADKSGLDADAAPKEFRLHRENCKAMNGSQRSVEDMLAENPEAVAAATPHSVCSPSKTATFSVHHQAQTIIDANAKKAARKSTPPKESTVTTKTAAKTAKTAAAKPDAAPAKVRTLADTQGTQKCTGPCGETKPLTAFPTRAAKPGEKPSRGTVCRADLRAARDANKTATPSA